MAGHDERNFRTYYYEKFGIGGVDEKKSLEILLKEQPLNIEKLRQFSLRFQVPAMYRIHLWKAILGITPANSKSTDFVMSQRRQQYEDLHHALVIMRRIDSHTPPGEVYTKMFLLQTGMLSFEDHDLNNPENQALVSMGTSVSGIVEDDVDGYWITTKFYTQFSKCKESLQQLPEKTIQYLKREDNDQRLVNHLNKHDVWSCLPLVDWYRRCFSNVLPDTSFERVWDKVIGGSCSILIYVAVSIFLTFKRPLLSMNSRDDMVNYLLKIPEDSGDVLVIQAIELWQKHGGHMIQTKSDSPIFVDRSPS
ncbi:TBC1 domain family member 7-like isoform X2 [Pecten maximus]|nr:TBC1 domain family member 7-like isoform X2 [Pecten maximus]XP_033752444.1 TBC1 domain family member 7-like isoform X2 [Pecten maximus]